MWQMNRKGYGNRFPLLHEEIQPEYSLRCGIFKYLSNSKYLSIIMAFIYTGDR